MKRTLCLFVAVALTVPAMAEGNISGRVTCKGNPVPGISVSDGVTIVQTDDKGRYSIQSDKYDGTVFIITPRGYRCETIDGLRPRFWQPLYLPVDQSEIHDFKLVPQDQRRYRVMFTTDCHLTGVERRQDLARFKDLVFPTLCKEAAEATGAVYTFNLGDTTHEIYWYEYNFDEQDALKYLQDLNYPTLFYSITGNHDHDGAIVGEDVDRRAYWMERDCWGPGAYSLNLGEDHWIFLDDIVYINVEGKGKKAPGIKGDRSYNEKLTDRQLAWLEKDLALVDKNTKVYICCHCPFLSGKKNNGLYIPEAQMDKIASLCEKFTKPVGVYSGHIHMFDFCENAKYPKFRQYSLPATSGVMWETPVDWPLYSSDGCDAGVWVGDFGHGIIPNFHFTAFKGGESYYRFYDMNEVGKAYKASAGVKIQQEMFPDTRIDYGKKEWKNQVFVNYWAERPGDVVELFENGKALKVTHEALEDPVKNFAYDVNILEHPSAHQNNRSKDSCIHLYQAKTRSAKSPITVKISDKNGNVKYEETFTRPYAFNPSGK